MTRPTLAVDHAERPVASWYTESTSDGLGDRLLMFDNAGTPSLELLRFRPWLAAADGFEDGLRSRVAELAGFDHPAFTHVRAVQHLDGGSLALVSTFTNGKRLSEILRATRRTGGVHPTFAAWLIRDLSAALAAFHDRGSGVAHGALTADRIVVTPDRQLTITEHVVGGALADLHLAPMRLWQEFGLLAPVNGSGARLDARTDMIQLGWMVLSALLGRRLAADDYPRRVGALLDEFERGNGAKSPALIDPLRAWLERALQVDGASFASAIEANASLDRLALHGVGPTPLPLPPPVFRGETVGVRPHLAPEGTFSGLADTPGVRPHVGSEDTYRSSAETSGVRPHLGWIAAAIFAAAAIGEGAMLARVRPAPTPPAPTGIAVTLESGDAGDAVVVDGRQVGVTPLAVTLTPQTKSVSIKTRVSAPAEPQPAVVAATAAPAADTATAAALAQARERRGGLRLTTPIEVQVLEGEHVLGSSADGPIVTTAGRHELDFINTAFGYRLHQVVEIKAGQITKMTVTPPGGRVSVNAVPWAQVWIDGAQAGETPLANLPLPIGEHQVTFRHPQLGEQTQRVIVKADALTRVSAAFAR